MCVRLSCLAWMLLLPLPLLLLIPGGLCRDWSVVYREQRVCAVRNTTAVFRCSFTYPASCTVTEVKWAHGESYNFFHGPFIFDSEINNSSTKFQYIGNKTSNCSLKIHQVEQTDAGHYAFRFITNIPTGKFTGLNGPELQVTDLNVLLSSGNGTVKEGDSLNLTCRNDCDGTKASSSFTWFKNGLPFWNGTVLGLTSVSSWDSGNYSCSLSKHPGTTSGVQDVNVEYSPKNTSVSVEPSMEVDMGSNFTLTCSSQANPPVEKYVWFKVNEDKLVEAGNQPVLVSSDEGQFVCRASNKHGSQNSSVMTLMFKETPNTFEVIIYIVVLLLVVIVSTAITWFIMKRRQRAAEENTQVAVQMNTVYANWHPSEGNNQPQAGNDCDRVGTVDVVYASVVFGPGKMEQKGQQLEDLDGGTIYSTVSK